MTIEAQDSSNAALVFELMLVALRQAQAYAQALAAAKAENRDIGKAELDALTAEDDAARARLQHSIDVD